MLFKQIIPGCCLLKRHSVRDEAIELRLIGCQTLQSLAEDGSDGCAAEIDTAERE